MQSLTNQFLTFCRSKPAGETYRFFDVAECACGQFAQSLGWDPLAEDAGDDRLRLSIERRFGGAAISPPHTFGALADRLEKLV